MKRIFAIAALVCAITCIHAQTDEWTELTDNPFPQTDRQPCMIDFAAPVISDTRQGMHRSNMKQADAPLYSKGSPEIAVVLANFSDVKLQDPSTATDDNGYARYFRGTLKELFDSFFNGSDFPNNPMKRPGLNRFSVAEYFSLVSQGQFTPHFTILDPVTLPKTKTGYGSNRDNVRNDALLAVADQIKNRVSDFDNNRGVKDDIVDGVIIIFPGQGKNTTSDKSANPGYIHPCCWGGKVTAGGISYATQLIAPELYENGSMMIINGLGVYVHEMSHMLGLPDFYDTNYKGPGMDYWSLMDAGEYVNGGYNPTPYTAYEKIYMDWIQPVELKGPTTITNLTNVSDGGDAYIIYNDAAKNEYYLLENLNNKNNVVYGTMQNFFGGGLAIYHVDESASAWNGNAVNTVVNHQRMTIIPANGHIEIQDNFTKGSNPQYEKLASELVGHLWPLKQQPVTTYFLRDGNGKPITVDPLQYWGLTSGNDELTDEERTSGDRIAPAATLYNENTDGQKLMHKPITDITMNDDGTISFLFMGGKPTAVRDIAENNPDDIVEIFTVNGVRLGHGTLRSRIGSTVMPHGVYIIRNTATGKTTKILM